MARDGPRQDASELKYLVFTVPGVKVGGLIDVKYTRIYTAIALVPSWVFGRELPVVRAELALVINPGVKVDYRYGHGEQLGENQPLRRKLPDGRERLVFVEQDLPAYYGEPRMPHRARGSPWVATVVTSATVVDTVVSV